MTMTTDATTADRVGTRNRAARGLAVFAGVGYTVAWIVSVSVGAPEPSVAATGGQVVAAFAGRGGPTMIMFVLAEGLAAAALAVVVILTARAAGRQGAGRAGLTAAGFGMAAVAVSWAELGLGAWLVLGLVVSRRAATAGTVYHLLMRLDGGKMFLLAGMALALAAVAVTSTALPRWLAPTGLLLAAALVTSGLGYVLLAPGLAASVLASGVLLLIFVTATGTTLRARTGSAQLAR
jgi:hypothetical protein